jgi:hypothetical protein
VRVTSKLLEGGVKCKYCESSHLHVHNRQERTLKTSIGEVTLYLCRVKCQTCKRTFAPVNQLLDLDPFSRKSREFEKLSLETVTEQSFRRSADHLEKTIGVDLSHTTLHGWFMKTEATQMSVAKKVDSLIADGTGYKVKPREDGSNRGEVRVMIGLTKIGEVIPYGAWTRASWKDIGRFIKKENHSSEKIKFKPIAKTLITDGEEELIRALKKLANSHQRCLFHMTYELKPLLQYKDIVGKDEAIKITKQLGDIIYLDMPECDADPIRNLEEKLKIEIKFKEVKEKLEAFIRELKMMGYKKAMTFVENSKNQLFT